MKKPTIYQRQNISIWTGARNLGMSREDLRALALDLFPNAELSDDGGASISSLAPDRRRKLIGELNARGARVPNPYVRPSRLKDGGSRLPTPAQRRFISDLLDQLERRIAPKGERVVRDRQGFCRAILGREVKTSADAGALIERLKLKDQQTRHYRRIGRTG